MNEKFWTNSIDDDRKKRNKVTYRLLFGDRTLVCVLRFGKGPVKGVIGPWVGTGSLICI